MKYLLTAALVAICLFVVGRIYPSDGGRTEEYKPPYNVVAESVVKITDLSGSMGGTGFLITAKSGKNVIITNWHICSADVGGAGFYANRGDQVKDYPLIVREIDIANDLCVMSDTPGLPLKVGHKPMRFAAIYVVGHPLLHQATPTEGNYVGPREETIAFPPNPDTFCPEGSHQEYNLQYGSLCMLTMHLEETNMRIFPGNSGSPVVDATGDVVGVINSSSNETNNGAYVTLEALKALLEKY